MVSVPTSEGSPIPLPPVTPPYGSGETPAPPEKGDVTEEGAPNGTPVGAAEEPPILTPLGPEMPDTLSFDPGAIPSGGDACALTVTALCGGEIRYTLHTCEEHAAVALQTGFMTRSGAAEKWREEINKLYDALYEIGDEAARAAVRNDQSACWAYVDAWAALYHDDAALCDMLRLRCAELCCVVRTAPDPLPDSILGDWAMLMGDLPADRCGRAFDEATGEIVITLEDAHRQALQDTLDLVSGAAPYARAAAIAQSNAYWQTALDHAVNIAYRNADRDARKLIVTWRMALDAVIETRTALLDMLYPDAPEITAEAGLTLYRDALIDACGHK